MAWNLKTWYRRRILENESITDDLWLKAASRVRFLQGLSPVEIGRLRELVTLFLHAKQINGAHGLIITDAMRVMIAAQACILILNLDLDYYDGWVEIIVYPGEFMRDYEWMKQASCITRTNPRRANPGLAAR